MAVVACSAMAMAQTLNVRQGQVTYAFTAEQAGTMTYSDNGTLLSIGGKTFTVSEIDKIEVNTDAVEDFTVNVLYNGASAQVVVAGNVAPYITPTVSGAHVQVVQGDVSSLADEVAYSLSGSSSDGEFCLEGSYKCGLELRGLSLTNPSGPAINIQNGKRIDVSIKSGTENTLADGTGGDWKGTFRCKGHTEFKGKGTLTVMGNTSHAIWSKEYVEMKNCTINVTKAVGDGINCNQYFLMESGQLNISGVGDDGIQVSYKTDDNDVVIPLSEDADNTGLLSIKGGTLDISATGQAAKALKSEGSVNIDDGTLTLLASGAIDLSDTSDPSYTACIKATDFVQNGGTIKATVTGTAGRGVSATTITTNGGTLDITNSGAGQRGNSDNYTAKGLKGQDIALNAGTISISMTGAGGKGIRAGEGTKTSSWGGGTSYSQVKGSYTQGLADGTGPTLTVKTTGSSVNGSSAKAIKAICAAVLYGGETTVNTATSGAEGLESKTSVDIRGGQHYLRCYDDCINSAGKIIFNGGVTVCYATGNDAVDSNYGSQGAITIGNGVAFAYTTRGDPEEGFDCDNNSYIQITGTGIGISAGAAQGGGGGGGGPWGGWGGGSSSSGSTISNAKQGYAFVTDKISYNAGTYYTLSDASGNNLVTYSFEGRLTSSLSLMTATGMVKGSTYYVKSSTSAPTDATTAFHGLYLGSSAKGTTAVTSFQAK